MRKVFKISCFVLFLLVFFGNSISVYANESPYLRIGLVSHASEQTSITINANSLEIGRFDGSSFVATGLIHSASGFIAVPTNASFVQLSYVFTTFQSAINQSNLLPNSFPALLEDGNFGVYMPAGSAQGTTLGASSRRVALMADGQIVLVSENGSQNLQFRTPEHITPVNARRYRGVIEVARFANQNITAVNIVHMEQYLYSVVPSEMPALWHMEALKAQAVAARTYATNRRGQFAAQGFDLVDTIFSQVYLGVDNEHDRSTQAVRDTAGIMIFYNNRPIEAVYFSSSGGFTDNSENVWVAQRPYLRAVAERYEPTAMEWSRTITLSELNRLLQNNSINIGQAQAINIAISANRRVQALTIIGSGGSHLIEREAIRTFFSGLAGGSLQSRHFSIAVATVDGQMPADLPSPPPQATSQAVFMLGAETARQASLSELNLPANPVALSRAGLFAVAYDQDFTPTAPNRNINTQIVQNQTSIGYEIVLNGRGWGHGVGMSQHGAHGMAQIGYNFRQILAWYYTGVEIR